MQQAIIPIHDATVGHSRQIHIDPSTTFQTLLGFGNALTDAALLNFKKMTSKVQAELLEQYWGASGTQFQVGRIPISSTDFSTHVYSYNDNPGDTSLSKFSIDVDRKMGKIDFIDKVLSKASTAGRQMTLFASSWAAPIWMTAENSAVDNPTLKDGPTGATAHVYAQYLVQFFEEYGKAGIKFWGLTAQVHTHTA